MITELDVGGDELDRELGGNIVGPTAAWVMREAWLCPSPEELTAAIGHKLLEDGIAVSRISVMIWSLHPMIAGKNYVWTKANDKVESYAPSYDIFMSPGFRQQPDPACQQGAGRRSTEFAGGRKASSAFRSWTT